jgi:hypothetical protein
MMDLMPKSLPIFVGSTFADLEPHRAAVLYALQLLEAVVSGMEHFGSFRAFKAHLKQQHDVSFFTTPDDLAMRVTQDVARLIQEGGLSVQESALARIVENLPRVDWLTEERFAFLKKEIGNAAEPVGSDVVLREALEFMLSGDNLSAAFLLTRTTHLNVREAIDLLMEITRRLGTVIVRGYKAMEKEGRCLTAVRTGVSGLCFQALPPSIPGRSTA